MKTNKRGFTLIEILIVVLIIAVLATIAVSAYQKAVVKSRFGSLMPLAKALTSANEEFYLRNGRYATNVTDLDVTSGGTTRAQITMGNESDHKYVLLTRNDMRNQLRMYQKHSKNFPGETHCEALTDDELANWLCRDSLKGTLVGNKFGYTVYSLSEETVGSLGRTYYNGQGHTGTYKDGDSCEATTWGCSRVTIGDGGKCIANGEWGCHVVTVTNGECIANANAGCNSGSYNNSTCTATASGGCWGTATHTNHSVCKAGGTDTCGGGKTFSDHSSCEAKAIHSCYDNSYTDHSVCQGSASYTCHYDGHGGNTYSNYSSCVGGANGTCTRLQFTNNSWCQANANGSCTSSNKYDSTSFCTGTYCPAGTPKGTWNESTETYQLDGWNGGCCNASYMTDGTCPSGAQVCS